MKQRGTKELEQVKHLDLKIQKVMSKNVGITSEKKGKQYVRQIIYNNQRHLPTKVTLSIEFTDEPAVQYGVPVMENTLFDNCK